MVLEHRLRAFFVTSAIIPIWFPYCGVIVIGYITRGRRVADPPAVRTRSARDPHRYRTGAAPVPHRCRTGAAPVPPPFRSESARVPENNPEGEKKKLGVFFVVFGVFVLLGVI